MTQESLHLAVNLHNPVPVAVQGGRGQGGACVPDGAAHGGQDRGAVPVIGSVIHAEQVVLRALDFNVWAPGPFSFLRRVSAADGYNPEHRLAAKILLDVALYDHRMLAFPPSQVAAVSMLLARKVYASAHHRDELQPAVQMLIEGVCDMDEATLDGFSLKYVKVAVDADGKEPKGMRLMRRMARLVFEHTRQRWGAEVRTRRSAADAAGIMATEGAVPTR
ncbi:hypothetical protein AMAG_03663 [Allomyces macrogynus ATCC 38327]|uniref:Cyclin C-terminal domain-containing protein n=1 Tax=Allomyces macrogynus (strain ATCC 38327) TaxID=578462 RepID=A0A0L0SAA7_ALLM3|nr:hypothetical protein AMAG_03663 [Allomyces macrogynus ATCC 38327]|eukprot:KNE59372.1 hypothetical protein AMAG_03663 [Allomyces macrogynus ATCC 38327]